MDNKVIRKKGFDIVIEEGFEKLKFDCPLCKLALRGLEDVESVQNHGVCTDCQDLFYWPNLEKWKNGWRPKKEEVYSKLNNYYIVKEK
jgi:hypothetical protein